MHTLKLLILKFSLNFDGNLLLVHEISLSLNYANEDDDNNIYEEQQISEEWNKIGFLTLCLFLFEAILGQGTFFFKLLHLFFTRLQVFQNMLFVH